MRAATKTLQPTELKAMPSLLNEPTQSIRRGVWGLVLIALGFTLYLTSSFILPIMVAGTLALLLAPAVGALGRLRLPQPLGAGIVMIVVLAALGTLAYNVAGPVQRWIDIAPNELRRLEDKVSMLMRPVAAVREAGEKVAEMTKTDAKPKPREVVVERRPATSMLNLTLDTIVTVLSTAMLLYFLLASGDLLVRKLLLVTPDREGKLRMLGILRTIQREIGQYFATITLVNIGLGVASGLAMWALGMPTPVVWAVAIALLNFLPYIGPLIATVLLGAVALLTFDAPLDILAPPAAFLLLNFIEDQLLLPFLFGRRLSLNPVVIFIWVLFWAWMWGIGGLLLAVPLLVAVRICAERVPVLNPLAIILARTPVTR
ncbi:MAG: AI-2E family transporter [Betaproteobacteria bacterium]|nr:MAG: AI-2E family transporter [Betaproteobacteria bacterium]